MGATLGPSKAQPRWLQVMSPTEGGSPTTHRHQVRDPSLMRHDARADALVGRDASIHGVPPPLWIGVVCPSRQASHQLGAQPVALPPPLPKPQPMCVCPPHPKTMIERGWACIGDTMDGFGGQQMMSR
jgi:hypothetical protein